MGFSSFETPDADTVCRLIDEGDQLAQSFLRKPEVPHKPEYNHIDLRQGLLRHPTLRALVTQSSTVPLVVQLLSPNIHLHSTTLIYKRPSRPQVSAFRRGWHRDIRIHAILETSPSRVLVSRSATA